MNNEEIILSDIIFAIKKRLILVLGLCLLFTILTYLFTSLVIQPKYTANSTLIIGQSSEYQTNTSTLEYNDILLSQKLVGTYGEIIKSNSIMQKVIDNLQLNTHADFLRDKIRVRTVNNTEIINLSVEDTIPERAMDIANETSEIFIHEIKTIMKIDNVQIIDPATMPTQPTSPNLMMNLAVAAVLGFMTGTIIAIYRELSDSRIKSIDELKSNFDIPVIGIIPNK